MKTKIKYQTRKMLRLRIIEHYGTQSRFAYESKIDEGVLSKLVNCTRDPSEKQVKLLVNLLKTPAKALFKRFNV